MITIIIIIILGLVLDLILKKEGLKIRIFSFSILYIIISFFSYINYNRLENENFTEKYTIIVSLERGSETSGDFVLGFGTINTDIYYYAYHQNGSNSYELVKFPLYLDINHKGYKDPNYLKINIIEDNNEQPRYFEKYKCEEGFYNMWEFILGPKIYCDITSRGIYVPKGTIQRKFNG